MVFTDRLAQFRVCPVVQGGGSVVQDQDFRIRRQRAGDQEALLLPAGKVRPADCRLMVVSVLVRFNKALRHGVLRGADHHPVGDIAPEGNILADGIGKNDVILENDAELPVEVVPPIGAYVFPVHENTAFLRIVKAHQQVDDACLSASGRPDNTQAPALPDPEGNVLQALLPFLAEELAVRFARFVRVVAEGHPVKDQRFVARRFGKLRGRHRRQLLRQVDDLADAVGGCVGLRHHHENTVQAHDAHQDHIEIGQECKDDPGFRLAAVHALCANQHHQRQPDVQEQRHDRPGQAHDDAGLDLLAGHAGICFPETLFLVRFLAQRFDDTDAGDALPHPPNQHVHPPLDFIEERNALPGYEAYQHDHNRRHDAEYRSQACIHRQGDRDAADQHDRRTDPHRLDHADEILDVIGIAGHPGDQGRQPDLVHLPPGKVQGRMEKVPPDSIGAVAGDADTHPVRGNIQDSCDERQQQHHAAPCGNRPRVVRRRNHMVKQMLQHVGHQQVGSRTDQFDQHHGQDKPPVRADVSPDQFHGRAGLLWLPDLLSSSDPLYAAFRFPARDGMYRLRFSIPAGIILTELIVR